MIDKTIYSAHDLKLSNSLKIIDSPLSIVVTEQTGGFPHKAGDDNNSSNILFKCQSMLNMKTALSPLDVLKVNCSDPAQKSLTRSQFFKDHSKLTHSNEISTQNLSNSNQYFLYSSHRLNRKCLSRINLNHFLPKTSTSGEEMENFKDSGHDSIKFKKRSVHFLGTGELFRI